jgi:hypothetical protein
MRLSGLVVAAILLVSATLSAQHTSGTGGSSSGSSSSSSSSSHESASSSSASSSGSSNSGASHGSYSGGSSSSGSSSGSHSSGSSSSASSHGSAGGSSATSSHNSSSSASHLASTGAASHPSVQPLRSTGEHAVREPKTPVEIGKRNPSPSTKLPTPKATAPPEKKRFFSFLRHPFRKPEPVQTAKFKRPVPCRKGPCPVCPPGESRNGKGVCVAVVASNQCQPGESWNVGASGATACQPGTFWNGVSCVDYGGRCGSAELVAAELRGLKGQMQAACSSNSSAQQCSDLKQRHEEALSRYRMFLNGAPTACRTMLPDPLSL